MGFMLCGNYMFLSNNPSSGDINSSNLPCFDSGLVTYQIKGKKCRTIW